MRRHKDAKGVGRKKENRWNGKRREKESVVRGICCISSESERYAIILIMSVNFPTGDEAEEDVSSGCWKSESPNVYR